MTTVSNVIDWPNAPPNPIPKPERPVASVLPTNDLIRLYEQTVRWQYEEMRRKNYEIAGLRDRVISYHEELTKMREGEPRSAYEVLQMIANDPTQPVGTRLRAAEAIVGFERPKLSASVNKNITGGIGAQLDRLNQERVALAPHRPIWPAKAGNEA
jgi:hypothetical protein